MMKISNLHPPHLLRRCAAPEELISALGSSPSRHATRNVIAGIDNAMLVGTCVDQNANWIINSVRVDLINVRLMEISMAGAGGSDQLS